MSDDNKKTWRVVETIPESADVTSVVIEGPEDAPEHQPGQFASLRVLQDDGTWSPPHPFTISCEPGGGRRRFTIKKIGDFTAGVRSWKPGTPVQCSGPMGAFCKDIDRHANIVMIAGGVGITPFLSVLRAFREQGADNRVTLFWANKTVEDAFARRELAEMTRELNLKVVHVISREEPPPDESGRVVYERGRFDMDMLYRHLDSLEASYYLCGPPAMQETVLKELERCGIDKEQVQREAFVPASR
jgi:predicted ferric reductase